MQVSTTSCTSPRDSASACRCARDQPRERLEFDSAVGRAAGSPALAPAPARRPSALRRPRGVARPHERLGMLQAPPPRRPRPRGSSAPRACRPARPRRAGHPRSTPRRPPSPSPPDGSHWKRSVCRTVDRAATRSTLERVRPGGMLAAAWTRRSRPRWPPATRPRNPRSSSAARCSTARCCPRSASCSRSPRRTGTGLVAGATGTGKTKTLQVLAGQLGGGGAGVRRRREGRPDRARDARRRDGREDRGARRVPWRWPFTPAAHPVELLSLTGALGAPVRATIARSARCSSARSWIERDADLRALDGVRVLRPP